MRTILHAFLFLSTLLVAVADLHAGCMRCGAQCATRRVCRTICTTKSVECTEWGEVCREVCLPPHSPSGGLSGLLSRLCGFGDHSGCDDPACDDPSCTDCHDGPVLCDDPEGGLLAGHGPASWFSRLHGTCDSRTRKKLMRKTIITQVPVTECVVEELCPQCCVAAGTTTVQPALAIPPSTDYQPAAQPTAPPVTAPKDSIEEPRTATSPPQSLPGFTAAPVPTAAPPTRPFFQTVGDDPAPATASGAEVTPAGVFFQQVGEEEPRGERDLPPVPSAIDAPAAASAMPQLPSAPQPLPLSPPAHPRSPAAMLKKSAKIAPKPYNYAPNTGPSSTVTPPAASGLANEL